MFSWGSASGIGRGFACFQEGNLLSLLEWYSLIRNVWKMSWIFQSGSNWSLMLSIDDQDTRISKGPSQGNCSLLCIEVFHLMFFMLSITNYPELYSRLGHLLLLAWASCEEWDSMIAFDTIYWMTRSASKNLSVAGMEVLMYGSGRNFSWQPNHR